MKNVIISNKIIGETPLECLERIRIENNIDKSIPMTYAGRLDPMAYGLMIILIGDECKNKEKYLGLDKEYEIEMLFGIKTDSYDILGIIENVETNKIEEFNIEKWKGKFDQEYPRYSSKIIAMKDENRDALEEMPSKKVEIYEIEKLDEINKNGKDIAKESIEKINKVKGDFRQEKIIKSWQDFAKKYGNSIFKIIKLKILCSSGTYMRVLAHNNNAIAYSINRTRIIK